MIMIIIMILLMILLILMKILKLLKVIIGIELEQKYFELSLNRLNDAIVAVV
jgi:hypothetical protein